MNADQRRLEKPEQMPQGIRVDLRSSVVMNPRKEGSALIMVLAVAVILALLVADFASGMKTELRAAGGQLEEAANFQLARSALALARLELARKNTSLYADEYGNAFFVTGNEDYEAQIEELLQLREGYDLGRGRASYRIIYKPNALDPNSVSANDWHRLLEVACGMEEGDERSELVDAVLDWTDRDNLVRASGAEEEFYQTLEPPRHARNAPLASYEELLLVHGFTPEMLYGYSNPVRVEDGMLVGGGLLRYFIGDNSAEARAARKYIVDGVLPSEKERNREEEERYRKVPKKPQYLYLIAQGYIPESLTEEDALFFEDEQQRAEPIYQSRHIILIRLVLSKDTYRIKDMQENAGAEAVERILAYGVPDSGEF